MAKFFYFFLLVFLLISAYQHYNRPPTIQQVKLIEYLSSKKTLSTQILRDIKKISQHDLEHIKIKYDVAQLKINTFIDRIVFKAKLGDNDISLEMKNISEIDNAISELNNSISSHTEYAIEAFKDKKIYAKADIGDIIAPIIRELPSLLRDEKRRKIIAKEIKKYKWDRFYSDLPNFPYFKGY